MTPPSPSLSRPIQQSQSETACSYEKETDKWLIQFSHTFHLWLGYWLGRTSWFTQMCLGHYPLPLALNLWTIFKYIDLQWRGMNFQSKYNSFKVPYWMTVQLGFIYHTVSSSSTINHSVSTMKITSDKTEVHFCTHDIPMHDLKLHIRQSKYHTSKITHHLSYLCDWRSDSWKVDNQTKHKVKDLCVFTCPALLLQWQPTLNQMHTMSLNPGKHFHNCQDRLYL